MQVDSATLGVIFSRRVVLLSMVATASLVLTLVGFERPVLDFGIPAIVVITTIALVQERLLLRRVGIAQEKLSVLLEASREREREAEVRERKLAEGDRGAVIEHLASVLVLSDLDSFDWERFAPESAVDLDELEEELANTLLDYDRESKTVILRFRPRRIVYHDDKKQSLRKVRQDTELQCYADCIVFFNAVFGDETLEAHVEEMRICLLKDDYKIGGSLVDELTLSRDQFGGIPEDYGPEYLLEMAKGPLRDSLAVKGLQGLACSDEEAEGTGYVYILINPSLKGLLKIGRTKRYSEERAKEISTATGVPTEFVVAYEQRFADCDIAEARVHQRLHAYRVSGNREFFRLPLKDAIQVILEVAEELGD